MRELLSRLHFADENTMPPLNPEDLYLGDLEVHPRFFCMRMLLHRRLPYYAHFFYFFSCFVPLATEAPRSFLSFISLLIPRDSRKSPIHSRVGSGARLKKKNYASALFPPLVYFRSCTYLKIEENPPIHSRVGSSNLPSTAPFCSCHAHHIYYIVFHTQW